MDKIDGLICEMYDNGCSIKKINRRLRLTTIRTAGVVNTLIVHHTVVNYNALTNKYDSITIPSKINYNIRLYGRSEIRNNKRKVANRKPKQKDSGSKF